jgi:putative hydrolase of the HAD superfamily
VITVVLFDLDDTLFAHRLAVETGVVAHLRSLGAELHGPALSSEVARWNELEEEHYHRYLSGELEYLGQRRARARDFMEPYGVTFADDSAAEQWFEVYLEQYRAAWTLYDDTLAVLRDLAGLRLGIITNGDLAFQLAKLDVLGLAPFFEHVIASGEYGITKPDPRIFEHACAQFGVAPSEAAYVGDRRNTDALGAAAAGLTGIWLNRPTASAAAQGPAVIATDARIHEIASLAQLPALLALLHAV